MFAAALNGNKRAELVGEHTIGRAAVQKLVKLPEGRALWLTYASYYRPGSVRRSRRRSRPQSQARRPDSATQPAEKPVVSMVREAPIQGKGLEPDVDVDDADVVEFGAATSDKDPILDAALERLKKGLRQIAPSDRSRPVFRSVDQLGPPLLNCSFGKASVFKT